MARRQTLTALGSGNVIGQDANGLNLYNATAMVAIKNRISGIKGTFRTALTRLVQQQQQLLQNQAQQVVGNVIQLGMQLGQVRILTLYKYEFYKQFYLNFISNIATTTNSAEPTV